MDKPVSEMVERVARAMCVSGGLDPDEPMANDGPRWKYYTVMAIAAIKAMREPNGSMVNAFVTRALSDGVHSDGEGWPGYARRQWTGMIDTALGDTNAA